MKKYERINRYTNDNHIQSIVKSSNDIVKLSVEGNKLYKIWDHLFKIQPYFGYSLTDPDTEVKVFEFFTN